MTGLLYAVKGDGVSLAELSDVSEDIKRRLLKVPMVKKIDIYGKQAKKVYVEFSHQRLAALGITPLAIAESLRNQNSVLASGSIDTSSDRVLVRVSGQFNSLDDIRNVPIAAGGRLIKLGDFTTITRGYEDPPTYTVRHNGQQVLMLGITMTNDGNIVDLGKAIEGAVAKLQAELPYGVELERVADQPTVVSDSIWEFERSLLEALAIVLAVSLISLGWRTGIVVGLSVPIVLGVVAIVMLATGWNLERVSLGSLIIALGLLVDDGIIAVEMMVVKMEEGWDRLKAAAYSYTATAIPRLTGALITVAAFMPIGFSKSTTGEYAGGIFWIVGTAVLFSWVVSGIITPYLAVKMLPKDFGKHHGSDPYRHAVLPQAARLDRPCHRAALAGHRRDRRRPCRRDLRKPIRAAAVLPQQLAAGAGRRAAPEGRLLVCRHDRAGQEDGVGPREGQRRPLLHRVHRCRPAALLPLARSGAAQPGLCGLRRHDERHGGARARALAPDGECGRAVPAGVGPRHSSGARAAGRLPGPVPRRRSGHPEGARDRARGRAVVASSPKVRDVQLDWNDPVRTLKVDLDQDKARALGLAPADVALVTQTVMNGATLSHLREREDLIDIVARAVPDERLISTR